MRHSVKSFRSKLSDHNAVLTKQDKDSYIVLMYIDDYIYKVSDFIDKNNIGDPTPTT